MNVEAEIRDLKRRVSELEGPFGFLSEQVKSVHRDLLAFEQETESRFDRLENKIDAVDRKIDVKVDGLAKALPRIVSDAVREATRDRDRKR